jgi:hypothetical protein
MIQKSFDIALKKGELAETIIKKKMEEKGYVIYQPQTEGAHCFDILAIKKKKNAVALDVKAKSRFSKWPATGIDMRHYMEYQYFSLKHRMPFWVVFVDEYLNKIYGNTLEELEKERIDGDLKYPRNMVTKDGKEIRIWPLSAMIEIGEISTKESEDLKVLSQRNYSYGDI